MSRFLFFITVALCFSFVQGPEKIITWSKDRPLTWADYRGAPQRRFAAASTVYSLGRYVSEKDGKIIATIEAFFYCKDSWKKLDWINDDVLAHEQRHFDIVELYARKFRKQLAGMSFKDQKDAAEKVESVYNILNQEMDVYQDAYDNESDGSMNGDGQREWNKKINEEINNLEEYASTVVTLKIKSSGN